MAVIQWPTIDVSLDDLLLWAQYYPDIGIVAKVLDAYPKVMTDPFLQARKPSCKKEIVNPADYVHNFVVPLNMVNTMERALDGFAARTARDERSRRKSGLPFTTRSNRSTGKVKTDSKRRWS